MTSTPPRTLVGWILPFVLVSGAMTAHWVINVPPGPLPPPVPSDTPKPSVKPAAGDDDDDDKDKDPVEPFTAPRSDNLLVQLHEAYDALAFKAEPTFEAWSVAHRPLITQIVTATRLQAFKGVVPSPSVSTSAVECHTIRCKFTLSSSKQEDVQALLDALAPLQLDGAPLWQLWKPGDVTEEPPKRKGAKPRLRAEVLVSFAQDLPRLDAITLDSGAPLKPARVTPVKIPPSPGATPTPAGARPVPSTSTVRPGGPATPTGAPSVPSTSTVRAGGPAPAPSSAPSAGGLGTRAAPHP